MNPQVWNYQKQKYVECVVIRQISGVGFYPNVEICVNGQKRIVGIGSLRNFYTNPERK